MRLVKGWEVDQDLDGKNDLVAIEWFDSKLNQALTEIEEKYGQFRMSDALMGVYKLIIDDFSSWYLELVKPGYQQPIAASTLEATIDFFEKIMKVLHPFMPFISEEIWSALRNREEGNDIIVSEYPKAGDQNNELMESANLAFEVISNVRSIRSNNQLGFKDPLKLVVKTDNTARFERFGPIITKMAFLEDFSFSDEKVEQCDSFVIKGDEFFIPMEGMVDLEKQKDEFEKELKRLQGFLKGIAGKLSNERFVNNAPEQVVANERKKQADTEAKIKVLEEKLSSLS